MKMTSKLLKSGKIFEFKPTEEIDDFRIAECSFSERIKKFCILFNGALFTFKSFTGLSGRLEKLKEKFQLTNLSIIEE